MAFDAASQGQHGGGGATTRWSHVLGAKGGASAGRLLVVGVGIEDNANPPAGVSSVTLEPSGGGATVATLTLVAGSVRTLDTGPFYNRTEIWYALEAALPAAGTYDVVVTYAETSTNNGCCGAVSWDDVVQQAREAVAATDNGGVSGNQIAVQITTLTSGALIIDIAGAGSGGTWTPAASQTERWDIASTSSSSAGSTREGGAAGAHTQSWTLSMSEDRLALSAAAFALPQNVFEESGADAGKGAEASDLAMTAEPSGADGGKGAEAPALDLTADLARAEGASAAEAPALALEAAASATDGILIAETADAGLALFASATDGAGAAEDTAADKQLAGTGTEGAKAAEAMALELEVAASGSDAAPAAEAATANMESAAAATDALSLIDSAVAEVLISMSAADAAGCAEASAAGFVLGPTVGLVYGRFRAMPAVGYSMARTTPAATGRDFRAVPALAGGLTTEPEG